MTLTGTVEPQGDQHKEEDDEPRKQNQSGDATASG